MAMPYLRKAAAVVHSVLHLVLVVFLLELFTRTGGTFTIFWFPLRFLAYAAVYPALTALLSGRESACSLFDLRRYALGFWKTYLGVSLALLLLDFLVFLFGGGMAFDFSLRAVREPVTLTVVAWILIRRETGRTIPLGLTGSLGDVLGLVGLSSMLWAVASLRDWGGPAWGDALLGMQVYIRCLLFAVFGVWLLDARSFKTSGQVRRGEILLINPTNEGLLFGLMNLFSRPNYPGFFFVLRAQTPRGYRVREYNRVFWHPRYFRSDALVAITCYTCNAHEAYWLAREFRRRGSKVVMGGPHVSALPQEALEFCDSVVVGDAEGVWGRIVRDYEAGSLQPTYQGRNMAESPYSEELFRALMREPPSVVADVLDMTRGCKFQCKFCCLPELSGRVVHNRPLDQAVALIGRAKGVARWIRFIDSNIYSHPAHARKLFESMIPLKVQWSSQCTVDIAASPEALDLAWRSGCRALSIGLEIPRGSSAQEEGGKFRMADKYQEYISRIQAKGIVVRTNFIFGFPEDRLGDLLGLWRYIFSLRPFLVATAFLTPFPGTAVFHEKMREDRMLNLNWKAYNTARQVFRHDHLPYSVFSRSSLWVHGLFLFTASKFGRMLLFVLAGVLLCLVWFV